jgi:hypothetical protein
LDSKPRSAGKLLATGVRMSRIFWARRRSFGVFVVLGEVGEFGGVDQEGEAALDDRLLAQEHAADVGVLDDGDLLRARIAGAGGAALAAVVGVAEGLVVGGGGGGHAVDADHDAGLVHHLEHVGEALVGLADQPAVAGALLAEVDDEAGQALPADLVDHAGGVDVVVDEGAGGVEAAARDDEQGDALDAGRGVVEAGEDQVDDVVGDVVIAAGDEDLVAVDAVGAVAGRGGAGGDVAEARAGLRLGEGHGAGPLAGVHAAHEGVAQEVVAEGLDEVGGAGGEAGVAVGAEVGGHEVGLGDDRHGARELLAADLGGAGGAEDPELGHLRPDRSHARVHGDAAVLEARGLEVHGAVGGEEEVAGEGAGAAQEQVEGLGAVLGEGGQATQGQHVGDLVELELHVTVRDEGVLVGHGAVG